MADKMMRIAGRGTDGTAKAFSVTNEGNPEVVIKGANIENDGTSSTASFRQDVNGNGIMRVYMENKLNASDGDSVNVDGVLANSFLRFPSGIYITQQNAPKVIPPRSAENYSDVVVLDIKTPIEITSFSMVTWGDLSNIRFAFYDASGNLAYLRTPTSAGWGTETLALQGMGEARMAKYTHPLFTAKQIDEATKEWEFTNRDGKPIYCPNGVQITLINGIEKEYKTTWSIAYKRFEVRL